MGGIISALTAAGIPQALATQIANAFSGSGSGATGAGGGGTDPTSILDSLTSSSGSPFGTDPNVASDINNVMGGNDGTVSMFGAGNLADSGASDSTVNLLSSLFGG